jgi:hypothetical protein
LPYNYSQFLHFLDQSIPLFSLQLLLDLRALESMVTIGSQLTLTHQLELLMEEMALKAQSHGAMMQMAQGTMGN